MWQNASAILNQAFERVINKAAGFLPGLLAMLVVVLFTILVAWIVRVALTRSLRRFAFDSRAGGVPNLAFWSVVLLGLLLGLSVIETQLSSVLVMKLFAYIPNVLAALVIVFVGLFLARFLSREVLISAVNMQIQSARLLSLGVKWLIIVMAGAMALEHLGIGVEIVRLSFGILFGGIVLALALAVGLGSKDVVTRTWERQSKTDDETTQEPLRHL